MDNVLLKQPPLPPEPPPDHSGFYQADDFSWSAVPPIAALLVREAEAWRALLNLHAGVVGAARQMAEAAAESEQTIENREAIELRQTTYFAALSQLAANCDKLSVEALKLRALRRARSETDVKALELVLQAHSVETLAVGATLATNCSTNVAAATAEVRAASIATRQQIAKVRALLQTIEDAPTLRARLLLSVEPYETNGGSRQTFTLEEVFAAVYAASAELTDESLMRAVERLCVDATRDEEPPVAPPARVTVRRSSERALGASR